VRDRVPALATCFVVEGSAGAGGPGAEQYEDVLAAASATPPIDRPDLAAASARRLLGASGKVLKFQLRETYSKEPAAQLQDA
jgi:hypothetical protein